MDKLVELFCSVDDFFKEFLPAWKRRLLWQHPGKRLRDGRLSESEIATLIIHFHQSPFKNFKHYYLDYVKKELDFYFPSLVSYNRFIELIPSIMIPLCAYLKTRYVSGSGIQFIDSTCISVCHYKRISGHKVFKDIAAIGKSTKGWFYGFKLHVICDHTGELVNCKITPGNVDDHAPVLQLAKNILGKLFGDKGYISQELFDQLFNQGLQLITSVKKNMKNKFMPLMDKILLRKRSLIESINNQFKNVFQLEHTRHRSPVNGLINMLAAVIAYTHHDSKPSIALTIEEENMAKYLTA